MFKSRTRRLAGVAIIAVLALAAFGFAAANTVPESGAGDGSGDISGYTVSNIHYTLAGADIDIVSFDLVPTAGAGAAQTVVAEIDGQQAVCTVGGSYDWDCNFATNPTAAAAASLRVIAAQ
jgi:hypothetical protein